MDCPTEEQLVRMALSDVPGVASLAFDLGARQLEAVHSGPAEGILGALAPLGMGATLDSTDPVARSVAGPRAESPAGDKPGAEPGVAPGVAPGAAQRRALWTVLGINLAMFVVELAAGLWAGSTGLLADSLDMLADASVYAIALIAVGRGRAGQRRAARTSGWLQLGLASLVLVEVARRAVGGSEPLDVAMVAIGLLALAANVTCLGLLAGHRRGEAHMRASWIFTTNDVLANLGVIVAGGLVWLTGSALPDLIIGTLIALLVASGAWRILRLP